MKHGKEMEAVERIAASREFAAPLPMGSLQEEVAACMNARTLALNPLLKNLSINLISNSKLSALTLLEEQRGQTSLNCQSLGYNFLKSAANASVFSTETS